ncbi:PREDICTED: SNF1-related protein kinase catalytic subunit alpha KIN10-like [Populus euphratica]|uniref:non-specific serine/threonine protein kinase n=1 Tax=Populus euphratica TaxID=75702 RepID=A0AAJ6X901_POPEU|nr:PREDICTED: SNF1-related protein kinase catalytic subunit alpha KIN10-like [Populus euphratica]
MPYFPVHSNSDSVEMEGSSRKKRSRVEMLSPNYKLGKTLGYGSFGEVKLAEHKLTGLHVAIKILNRHEMKKKGMEEKARREIKILKMLMHPHIIRLYEVIETSSDIFVVMEYAKCGELFEYILEKGRLEEDEARSFFQQTISGLEYCHRNMVVHRDLKPENLLLDSKHNVKIADFGLSNIMQDGHFLKTNCGSYNYAAPEVLARKLYAGPEVDIWSCGVILYALLCGSLPFDDESIPNLLRKIKGGLYSIPRYLSPGATDMISKMLVVDPMRRMNMHEIRQHPWFQAHLPRYLAVPLPDTMQHAKKIDGEIFQEVVKLGFDGKQLTESIICRTQNEATVAYHLLLDHQFRDSNGHLGAEIQETKENSLSSTHPDEPSSSTGRLPGHINPQGLALQFPSDRKWALGLQSRADPHEIMIVVLKALQELTVCWKKIGDYNMKCRWFPGTLEPQKGKAMAVKDHPVHNSDLLAQSSILEKYAIMNPPNVVKFEVQLYKTYEEKYLLDLQRVEGPQLLFLDLCAAFLVQLRVL